MARKVCLTFFAIVLIVSTILLVSLLLQEHRDTAKFEELKEISQDTYPFKLYPEMAGWLNIPDTKIDYPVMLSPDDPEKYLRANVDGEHSMSGTPFMDYRCNNDSPNIIIYGHNMHIGTMFAGLLKYKDKSYFEKHPVFTYTTRDGGIREYRIFACLKLDSKKDEQMYRVINDSNDDIDILVSDLKSMSLYETGLTPTGVQIMALSTCSYHSKNGRFMVAGFLTGEY